VKYTMRLIMRFVGTVVSVRLEDMVGICYICGS